MTLVYSVDGLGAAVVGGTVVGFGEWGRLCLQGLRILQGFGDVEGALELGVGLCVLGAGLDELGYGFSVVGVGDIGLFVVLGARDDDAVGAGVEEVAYGVRTGLDVVDGGVGCLPSSFG